MNTPSYKRLLLKLSGETLNGSQSFGINHEAVKALAVSLKGIREEGFQLAIVIGGGNIFRGVNLKDSGIARTPADHIGMLATLMNGIVLQQALLSENCPACVMTALECPKVAESYSWSKALSLLEKGEILIFVGGTGNPYFTTDTAAAMRASEIHADLFLKATKVDGVYNKDPNKDSTAVKYDTITYSQVLAEKLGVMDATAITMCRESHTPIYVFNMHLLGKEKMRHLLSQKKQGTLIKD
jgi:uridylate kinase